MKNRVLIYKISITFVALLSLLCNFLPIISANSLFVKYSVSAMDLFNMQFWEMLGEFSSDVNYSMIFRTVIAVLMILNLLTVLETWYCKNRFLYLIGVLDGVVQTFLWLFLVFVMFTNPDMNEILREGYVSIGIGIYGFIICGIVLLVLSTFLFVNQGPCYELRDEGCVVGLTGEYTGARIPIGKTPVVIGRDYHSCNVILQDNQISRQHCSIVYDVFRKTYIVRDFSSNGTFLEDGSRLKPNQINELPPGTKIRVGDNSTFVLK